MRRRAAAPLARTPAGDARPVLALIGNGMVSQRFCERAVELGLQRTRRLVVFGEEPLPAYDRVRLTSVLRGQDPASLVLRPAQWYRQSGIELRLGERVVWVDRAARQLLTARGERHGYDELVFATGSLAAMPVVPGAQHPGVLSYRRVEDAERIARRARVLARRGQRVAVIGAGVLGVEAGQALRALGCQVTFIEAAPHVVPRQLDPMTAGRVAELLLEAGCDLCLGQTVERILLLSEVRQPHPAGAAAPRAEEVPDVELRIELASGGLLGAVDCGMAVLALGVRPRDELARASGLACPAPGGIAIDSALMTSDPHVFAIGECASHGGRCPGLFAPGRAMADALAERLSGLPSTFRNVTPSTRLEVAGRPVVVLGEPGVKGRAPLEAVVHEDARGERFRRLVLERGRLIGATAIGDGPDLSPLGQAVVQHARLGRRARERLARGEHPWQTRAPLAIEAWPDSAVVCDCTGVTCGALRRALREGAAGAEQLTRKTGAGGVCGSCRPRLDALAGGRALELAAEPALAGLSLAALAAVSLALWHGPLRLGHTLATQLPLEPLWRDRLLQQLSGYALAALCLLAGAWMALRRRLGRRGRAPLSARAARSLHAALGLASLAALGAHTGLRWGRGFDLALSVSLVAMIVVGSTTALALSSGGPADARAAALRRLGLRLHVWIAWPLPVLIALHVVKSYYF